MTLLEKVMAPENLMHAFYECSRGKKRSHGFARLQVNRSEWFAETISKLAANKYRWGEYRTLWVCDPKRRQVMAAPFTDRVVHHAIHRVIEPLIDPLFLPTIFACRKGKGSRLAAQILWRELARMGPNRFTIKLDVRQYFASIRHDLLMVRLTAALPDNSLTPLLWSLLKSPQAYSECGRGIPIGNLTSQLFANFYLAEADALAWQQVSAVHNEPAGYYTRYMDDFVLIHPSKRKCLDATDEVRTYVEDHLDLHIPDTKRVVLGAAPIPFLGFCFDSDRYWILNRNRRRAERRVNRLSKEISMGTQSAHRLAVSLATFGAWGDLCTDFQKKTKMVLFS